MNKRLKRILIWTRWILLSLILLPVASLVLIKLSGSMKMRISDDQIIGAMHAYPIKKQLDTIVIRNRELSFLHTSKGDKKKKDVVIFLHGSPGSLDVYLDYMHNDTLLSKADLVAYDRPGFGHSDFGKAVPSLRQQSFVLFDLMKQLDYERYWLIGFGYGGDIIFQAAIDRPERMDGIGIIAGSLVYQTEPQAGWRKWFDLPFLRELLPFAWRVSNEELMALKNDLRMTDDDWSDISIPVSLMFGKDDKLDNPSNLQALQDKLMNADTVRVLSFPEENHVLLSTQKDMIIGEIIKLMNMRGEI